jgi:hypothetical protein
MYLYGYEFIKHWGVVNYIKGKGARARARDHKGHAVPYP